MLRPAVVLLLALGCSKPEPSTLEEIYADFAQAVRDGDAERIHKHLDLASRWAVMSVYRSERDIHRLARRHAGGPREREMARYRTAGESDGAAEFFARAYADRLEALRPKLTADVRFERAPDNKTAAVVTRGGDRIPFARGDDGRWGWMALREELEARKRWSANALQTLRDGAAQPRP